MPFYFSGGLLKSRHRASRADVESDRHSIIQYRNYTYPVHYPLTWPLILHIWHIKTCEMRANEKRKSNRTRIVEYFITYRLAELHQLQSARARVGSPLEVEPRGTVGRTVLSPTGYMLRPFSNRHTVVQLCKLTRHRITIRDTRLLLQTRDGTGALLAAGPVGRVSVTHT